MRVTTDAETGRLRVEDGTGRAYEIASVPVGTTVTIPDGHTLRAGSGIRIRTAEDAVAEHVERIRRAQDAYAEMLDERVKSIGAVEVPPLRPPIATRLHAFADWVASVDPISKLEVKERVCALIDGRPYQPRPEGLPWPEPPKGLPPLVKKLMRVLRLHYDGTLTDQTVATALREVLDEHAPKEPVRFAMRELSCQTCRRVFCRVLAPEETLIEPACPGCKLEGRA